MNRDAIKRELKFFTGMMLIGILAIGYVYFFEHDQKKNKPKTNIHTQKEK